jgi:hypothetical protein
MRTRVCTLLALAEGGGLAISILQSKVPELLRRPSDTSRIDDRRDELLL